MHSRMTGMHNNHMQQQKHAIRTIFSQVVHRKFPIQILTRKSSSIGINLYSQQDIEKSLNTKYLNHFSKE